MIIELREWKGMRTTFAPGLPEPVWVVETRARLIGSVPKAARFLGLPVMKLKAILHYAHENQYRIGHEREMALKAGFIPQQLDRSLPALVFPAKCLLRAPLAPNAGIGAIAETRRPSRQRRNRGRVAE